jgi:Flp pilus assembly protein TadG
MMWGKLTLRGRDDGAVAIEAALTLSALLVLLLGIIQFTVAFWQLSTMSLVVQQAGRYVMVSYATSTTCGTSCAQTWMQGILTSAAVCTTPTTSNPTCVSASLTTHNGTSGMTLTASYLFNFFALPATFPIASQIWVPLD